MKIEECFKVGYIMKPHGLKGEVTVSLDAEAPDNLEELDAIFLEDKSRLIPYFIEHISINGNKAFIKLEDINSQEKAATISKSSIYLPKSARPKSVRGEFYDDEVVGFEVTDEEAGALGKVQEVISAGPNKLLSVSFQNKEVLIPINSPFILSVNKSKKKITVMLPEGFLDL